MKYLSIVVIFSLIFSLFSCTANEEQKEHNSINSELSKDEEISFNAEASDSIAIVLADEVIAAHGGKQAWNNTRYIAWTFFGKRHLIWDKYSGLVRIEYPQEKSVYIINVKQDIGEVRLNNKPIIDSDSLSNYVERGKQIWVNDAYWLVFPFKLKDPGVQLSYLGQDTTQNGAQAEVISLKFQSVGFTPDNKYNAYIDPETKLILQWEYFQKASDSIPSLVRVWSDYAKYGELMLSAGRGERSLSNIAVSQKIDSVVFKF